MPLRHTKGGWMWGSKGPFPSKAKALSVARAAYAHGYKENDIENKIQENKRFNQFESKILLSKVKVICNCLLKCSCVYRQNNSLSPFLCNRFSSQSPRFLVNNTTRDSPLFLDNHILEWGQSKYRTSQYYSKRKKAF